MKTPRRVTVEDSVEAASQFWQAFDDRLLGHVETLRAQFAKSSLAVALQGAQVIELRGAGNSQRVSASPGRVVGWSIGESTGAAAAKVYLRDGPDANGSIVAVIPLVAGAVSNPTYLPSGLSFGNGLFVHIAAGAVEGAVYLGAVD